GQRAAEDGERAREDEAWRFLEMTARFEKRARRVDIDAHAEVELSLRLAADDRREVVHGVDAALDNRGRKAVVGDRPGSPVDARIVDRACRGIGGHERRDPRKAWRACEQRLHETPAEKSCSSCYQYRHAGSVLVSAFRQTVTV